MRITASGYARSRVETKPRILWWDSLLMARLLWLVEDQVADAAHVLDEARVLPDVEAPRAGQRGGGEQRVAQPGAPAEGGGSLDPPPPPVGRLLHGHPVDPDLAARARERAGHDLHQGGLAAPARAHDRHDPPRRDLERGRPERDL